MKGGYDGIKNQTYFRQILFNTIFSIICTAIKQYLIFFFLKISFQPYICFCSNFFKFCIFPSQLKKFSEMAWNPSMILTHKNNCWDIWIHDSTCSPSLISRKGRCQEKINCHTIFKLHKITSTNLLPFQYAKKWPETKKVRNHHFG